MSDSISTVAVTGGTHGNELTGVHLVKHWRLQPDEVKRDSFATELYLANPEAIKEIRRYIDQDLNRQFSLLDLENPELKGYEQQRAKQLNKLLGPKENPRVDLIIDMHTTTSNMGMTLVINSNDPFLVGMAFYVKQKIPHATLFYNPSDRAEDYFLNSVGRLSGFLIEVGPIAQGLLKHEVYSDTRAAVLHALDYIEQRNTGQQINLPKQMTGYEFIKKISLPTNAAGEIAAMVHPDLQDKDYQMIQPGDPLFITLSG